MNLINSKFINPYLYTNTSIKAIDTQLYPCNCNVPLKFILLRLPNSFVSVVFNPPFLSEPSVQSTPRYPFPEFHIFKHPMTCMAVWRVTRLEVTKKDKHRKYR